MLLKTRPPGERVAAIVNAHLSKQHLNHPKTGCALASLAPEIGRMAASVRERLNSATQLYMERMAKYMPGFNTEEKRKNFLLLFSGMAGAISVTRSLGNGDLRDGALELAREHYLKTFAAQDKVEKI